MTREDLADQILGMAEADRGLVRSKLVDLIGEFQCEVQWSLARRTSQPYAEVELSAEAYGELMRATPFVFRYCEKEDVREHIMYLRVKFVLADEVKIRKSFPPKK
jgi:hypothetical protein